ncbi:MAG: bifunctional hydroxymethylpyrimidine kinase/phosphomethylpyrimidine kinase [Hyphomonadaceae bacterium]|nr:bifunctional hydroxymethylpyrimidine kinase/phosphomethylpyrimidine kinase [Hyphomonadaceae bacterium]
MPLVLVISSYVAASRVGGGIAPYVLGPMKVDPVHVPTCLFGRHPGWGPPGGAAVEADVMAKMLEGIEANGLYSLIDAVVTGHFSKPEQVAVASDLIAKVRAAPRGKAHGHAPPQPIIIVDPVMGDEAPGLYISEPVAEALMRDLVPQADIVAPNLWEFARLMGLDISSLRTAEDVAARAKAAGGRWLISSVPSPKGIGVLHVDGDGALVAETPRVEGKIPNGTGDMLTLRFAGGLVSGFGAVGALADAVGATHTVISKTMEWQGPELSIAACSDLLANRHSVPTRKIS